MAGQLPISKADAARAKGVTRGAVTHACAPGGALAPAVLAGGRIDSGHRAYKAWLRGDGARSSRRKAPARAARGVTSRKPTSRKQRSDPPAARRARAESKELEPERHVPVPADAKELEEYAALLRPLLERFGTRRSFDDWLGALNQIEAILARHLKNEETQGRLISRELVRGAVFGALDALARQLLRDAPKTIARRLYALAKSGAGLEDGEKAVRENISSQIKPVKLRAVQVLRGAGPIEF